MFQIVASLQLCVVPLLCQDQTAFKLRKERINVNFDIASFDLLPVLLHGFMSGWVKGFWSGNGHRPTVGYRRHFHWACHMICSQMM